MIIANQEIAVHLKLIRNLTGITSGRFSIRLSLTDVNSPLKTMGTPFNLIQKDSTQKQNNSQFDEDFYTSKIFYLKSGMNVQLNQICLFKLNSPLQSRQTHNILLSQNQLRRRVISQCKLKITGHSFHQYLEINFYDAAPCQIVGGLHCCCYRFEFQGEKKEVIDMRAYAERYSMEKMQEIGEYLGQEGKQSYQVISELYEELTGKAPQVSCTFPTTNSQPQEPQLQLPLQSLPPPAPQSDTTSLIDQLQQPKLQKYISLALKGKGRKKLFSNINNEALKTQGDEEPHYETDPTIGQKKKRRKIFSTASKEFKFEKVQLNENLLHQNAQKIYQIWRMVIGELFSEAGSKFFTRKCLEYQTKIKQKVGESIVRFKGSRDVDLYGNEEDMRAKLAYQLRNQDKQFFKQHRNMLSSSFPVMDQAFFTNQRPIFFQQFAQSQPKTKIKTPKQLLVIMVHGLGACRLDMQKVKVQLKRYYDFRVRVYCSSSNEGRTEGNIDDMGARLANQVDHELSKYPQVPTVCFLGHSMGGVIIRSALHRLQKYKNNFHSLITLSSPHLGYTYSSSTLIDVGLWAINTWNKCQSILQLTMQDHSDPKQTFLYKLSTQPGLQWFKKIVFLASHQDLYVPYYSARVQKNEQSILDARKQVYKGMMYCKMIDNMLGNYKGEIVRLNVNFCIPEQNIDNLIGRAAHISFINNVEMVRTLVIAGPHYFF